MCEPPHEARTIDGLRECDLAGNLDHGQLDAVARLELGVPGDVDDAEVEGARFRELDQQQLGRPARAAVGRAIEHDPERTRQVR